MQSSRTLEYLRTERERAFQTFAKRYFRDLGIVIERFAPNVRNRLRNVNRARFRRGYHVQIGDFACRLTVQDTVVRAVRCIATHNDKFRQVRATVKAILRR